MEEKIRTLQTPVTTIHLGREPDEPFIMSQLPAAKDNLCLYIGSPVHACHALPPVTAFISSLPAAEHGYAVPFVTWGGVTSGIGLHGMGKALQERGYRVLGAAKILARHSLMWASDAPLGENHPDQEDDRMVVRLVERVECKIKNDEKAGIPLSALAYQPEAIRKPMEAMGLEAAKERLPPRKVKRELCTRCGVCADQCPVGAITLLPHPQFGPSCIYCFNCVRLCPDGAIEADLSKNHKRIRAMAENFNERPGSQLFL